MVTVRGVCVLINGGFAMDDGSVHCSGHCLVCDQQTAACQLCDDGYVLRDGERIALPSTACQSDHAGVCLACGVGAHSTASSSDNSVCAHWTAAHCLQCPLGVCSVSDGTGGFFLDATHTCSRTPPPPRRVRTRTLSSATQGCSPTVSVWRALPLSHTVARAPRRSARRVTMGSSSTQLARVSRPLSGCRQTTAGTCGALPAVLRR